MASCSILNTESLDESASRHDAVRERTVVRKLDLQVFPGPMGEDFLRCRGFSESLRMETAADLWRRRLRRVCKIAKVPQAHAHRFRHTFAVELLKKGVPIEEVSILLGHSSVRITERHYAAWVQARQRS